ncbi:MAG: heparinase II/III-family protein [Lachnospiraceae bacterium]|nr:heparinase II/III-family protein [Lachnospiraceae bacterium]
MGGRGKALRRFLKEYREDIRESAAWLMSEEMPALWREDFDLYEQKGNRLIYESAYFPRRKFLAVFGMEAILEKEETGTVDSTVLFRLCEVIEQICGEDTWALPAHVNRKENPGWRETVDLFAAETAQTLSELLDRLKGFLPEKLKDRMEAEISRRVLEPYYFSEVPYAGWEVGNSNWTAVCAGSIGSAVIHLSKAGWRLPKPLPECLDRVCAALPYYFQGFTDDGACMEGLQYYTYGMIYFANFAWELKELTGENLFQRPDIAAFPAKCFFPDGVSLSFSDGSSRDTFRVGLQALQAMEYGNAEFPAMERAAGLHSDTCYRFAGLKLDWFATMEYLRREEERTGKWEASGEETPLNDEKLTADCAISKKDDMKTEPGYRFHILPSAQWCVGYAKNGTGFACKGGHNGESHNHNDIGHLIYEAEGVLFLTDLGAGEYDRDYFSQNRYRAICNHSFGHSVPILNGQGQREGAAYRCTSFLAAVEECPEKRAADQTLTAGAKDRPEKEAIGRISAADTEKHPGTEDTGWISAAGTGTVRMEIGSAYSLSEGGEPLDGKTIVRQIRFELENGRAKITDRFDLRGDYDAANTALDVEKADANTGGDGLMEKDGALYNVSVMENLVTQILPVIEENRICLEQNGAKALIEVEKLPGMASPEIMVVEYDHRNHQGGTEKVYTIRWAVPLEEGRGVSSFSIQRI